MRVEEATDLLAKSGIPGVVLGPITGGWASWTFDLSADRILRIARDPEIDAAHRREARLLPELAKAVSFAVPVPTHFGVHNGLTYMVYRKLPGRGLRRTDRVATVAAMLAELHSFPQDRAAELLGCASTSKAWRDDYLDMWNWIEADVLPELDGPLRETLGTEFETATRELDDITPTLIHRDLGCEHILVDPDTGIPTGIIDFETATIGDPVIDFVGLLITFGEAETRRLIDASPGEMSWTRLRFYHWMGSVHAIGYGVRQKDAAIIADGVNGLRDRVRRTA